MQDPEIASEEQTSALTTPYDSPRIGGWGASPENSPRIAGRGASTAALRVAVIGQGGVGTAAARFLAAAGCQVVGFEQFQLDHDRGSSYGGSRIIRRVYPDPLYASLMDAAYPLWHDLERECGEELLLPCGGLFFGPEGHPEMIATEDALTAVGVPYQRLSPADTAEQHPQFRLRSDEYALWEPQSGLLRASRCVLANATGARAYCADLREQCPIRAIEPHGSGVRVHSAAGSEEFDRAVITGGPWTAGLIAPWLELPLRVTRQQYAHFAVEDPASFAPDRFPVWIDMAELFYGFPQHDAIPGIKAALHVPGPTHDPNSPDRSPSDGDSQLLYHYLTRRMRGMAVPDSADSPAIFSKVCLYTMSPDEDFVIRPLPGAEQVIFLGGLSGHGFKFTVLLGQIAARLAMGQDPGHNLERFRPDRWSASSTGSTGS